MHIKLRSLPPTKKYFVTMFAISCFLLAVFTLVIYQQSRQNENSTRWVIHSYEVLRYTRNILIHMYDADLAERNYLNAKSPEFLTAYDGALASINHDMDFLTTLTVDSPEQQNRVKTLRGDLQEFRKTTAAELTSFAQHGGTVYSQNEGARAHENAMSEVRAKIRECSQAEFDLLNSRMEKSREQQRNYMLTLFIGAMLNLGAVIIANLIIFSLIARNSRTEERYNESEKLFATILNGINDGVYDYNVTEGTITYSDSYPMIMGYTAEELGNKNDDFDEKFIHPDDVVEAREVMRRYLNREIPTYCNIFRVRHKDGRWLWVMSRGVGIWDKQGRIHRLIGTHTDITPQKQREEELNYFIRENESQKKELEEAKEKAEAANQAKSDFLATMSHEIRTPLNVVVGLAGLLMDKVQTPQKREMAETLYANADILSKLVNDLLDLTRIESAQIELESRPFTLGAVFKAVRAMFDNQVTAKGLGLTFVDNTNNQALVGDSVRLQQILINLISNALKFTARGGIKVTADCVLGDESSANLTISVADTGVGIPPEKLDAIFEKFVQADQTISRRFGGSGLGLAISKSLAQLMGGDISVVSKPGEGSSFTVFLRLQAGKQPEAVSVVKPIASTPPSGRGTVLVVEDYAANVMVARMLLENLGYDVDVATSGGEAIRKVEAHQGPYTAILMDVQMQDMDGFETTQRIRALETERGYRHFIIGVTAHALAGDRERCVDAGMDDYMSKPVHPDLLASKLGSVKKAA